MGPSLKDSNGPPLAFRFVSQSGRLVDKKTKRAVRSHAMREVRSRQKQKRQIKDNSLCRCSTSPPASPVLGTGGCRLDDMNPNLPLVISKRCSQCAGMKFLECPSSPEMEQLSPNITMFAVAQFDPFGSVTELPDSLTRNFSYELEAIKAHGE
jgi:hypothetical protein